MFWKFLSWLCRIHFVYEWLYDRIEKNPYWHIMSPDGSRVYMLRGWIIKRGSWWQKLLGLNFCVRIHHILVPDQDRHLHSHPFNYRTLVLKGWYDEERPEGCYLRRAGETGDGTMHTFHRITDISMWGAVTLFIMWGGERDKWGFMTEDGYVPNKEYFRMRNDQNGDPRTTFMQEAESYGMLRVPGADHTIVEGCFDSNCPDCSQRLPQ